MIYYSQPLDLIGIKLYYEYCFTLGLTAGGPADPRAYNLRRSSFLALGLGQPLLYEELKG